MLAQLSTATLIGVAGYPVRVEVDLAKGLPAMTVAGLDDAAVLQARDRIRAAFGNAGCDWPDRRITIALSPADLPKHGAGFDVPIAIGLLAAAGLVSTRALAGLWAVGELGLGGTCARSEACSQRRWRPGRAGRGCCWCHAATSPRRRWSPVCRSPVPAAWRRWRGGWAARARWTHPAAPGPRRRPPWSRTSPTCAASRWRGARWRSRRPGGTICC